jgi:hypothetical protein
MDLKSGKQVCAKPGCKEWAMKDGSGFCFMHNPNMAEKRETKVMANLASGDFIRWKQTSRF